MPPPNLSRIRHYNSRQPKPGLGRATPSKPGISTEAPYRRHIRTSATRSTQHRGPTNSSISSRHAAWPYRMQDMTPTAQPKQHQSSNHAPPVSALWKLTIPIRPTLHTSTHQLANLRDNNSTPHLALPRLKRIAFHAGRCVEEIFHFPNTFFSSAARRPADFFKAHSFVMAQQPFPCLSKYLACSMASHISNYMDQVEFVSDAEPTYEVSAGKCATDKTTS